VTTPNGPMGSPVMAAARLTDGKGFACNCTRWVVVAGYRARPWPSPHRTGWGLWRSYALRVGERLAPLGGDRQPGHLDRPQGGTDSHGPINPEMQRKDVARQNRILSRERVENLAPITSSRAPA
jgi:hypothetical protein